MNREPTAHELRAILDEGYGVNKSPADVLDGPLAQLLPDIDLLEAFLTGLISTAAEEPSGIRLTEEQFRIVERRLTDAPASSEIAMLRTYVERLSKAYGAYMRGRRPLP